MAAVDCLIDDLNSNVKISLFGCTGIEYEISYRFHHPLIFLKKYIAGRKDNSSTSLSLLYWYVRFTTKWVFEMIKTQVFDFNGHNRS